jgi:hypothetical protein
MEYNRYLPLKTFIILFFSIGCTRASQAQGYYLYDFNHYEPAVVLDLGFSMGLMNCVTDIGGNKNGTAGMTAYTTKSSQFGGGISLTGTYKDYLALRLEFNAGRVAAYDSTLSNATHYSAKGRYERNLHFRSSIYDVGLIFEVHPVFFRDYQIYDRYMPRVSPYLCFGIGATNFNPQAEYEGKWIDLTPLRLEGQGFSEYPDRQPYSKTFLTFPAGVGIRYEASRTFFLRAELLHRFTTTDYLDDVSEGDWVNPALFSQYLPTDQALIASQMYNRSTIINPPRNTRPRGDPKRNDTYWSACFKVGICLNRESTNYKPYAKGVRRNSYKGKFLGIF